MDWIFFNWKRLYEVGWTTCITFWSSQIFFFVVPTSITTFYFYYRAFSFDQRCPKKFQQYPTSRSRFVGMFLEFSTNFVAPASRKYAHNVISIRKTIKVLRHTIRRLIQLDHLNSGEGPGGEVAGINVKNVNWYLKNPHCKLNASKLSV